MNKKIGIMLHKGISIFAGAMVVVQSFLPGFSALAVSPVLAQEETPGPTVEQTLPPSGQAPTEEVTPTPDPSASQSLTDTPTPTPDAVIPTPTPTGDILPDGASTVAAPQESIPQSSEVQEPQNNSPPAEAQATEAPTPAPTITAKNKTKSQNGHINAAVLRNVEASLFLDLASPQEDSSATIVTDRADYAPTDAVVITGSGFTPNTTYKLVISSSDQPAITVEAQVTTNEEGSFIYTYQLDGNYRPNYTVEVQDASDKTVATTSFTDAKPTPTPTPPGPAPSWPTSWTTPSTCLSDNLNDQNPASTDITDITGDPNNPAVGFASDSNYQYFKERVGGNPSGPGGFDQFAWVVLFQITAPEYQFLGSLDGVSEKVQLWENTSPAGPVDFSPLLNDPAETLRWEGDTSFYARIEPAGGGAFYVEWAIPQSELAPRGITDSTTKFFTSSANSNNFNKDHLKCNEVLADLSIVKTDNPDPVNNGGTLTYTLTVTNAGPDPAGGVVVTDTLPAGYSVTSVTPSQGSCSDITAPSIQCELGTVNNGANATVTIVGTITGSGVVTNTASVALDPLTATDTNQANNTDSEDTTIAQTGSITLDKVTNPSSDPQSFSFSTTNLPAPTSPSLTDTATPVTWSSLANGTYTITETVPASWILTSRNCTGQATSVVTNITDGVSIALSGGESITCTFTNTKNGHLIVEKTTLPPLDQTQFPIEATGSGTITGGGAGTITDSTDKDYEVTPGTYSVSETVPAGWDKTGDTCQNVVVGDGQTVRCMLTNTKRGNIIIEKQTDPDGSNQSFEFSASYDQNGFSLTDGGSNDSGLLLPGVYSVSENVPSGWDLTSAICSDQSDPQSITLDPGETVICTFTNTKKGHLIVEKTTLPPLDQTQFPIEATGSGTITGGGAGTVTDGQDQDYEVTPGTYSVSEAVPAGWDQTLNTCDDIQVAAGGRETCTIVNTKRGSIIVEKQTNPDGATGSFTFTGDASGTISDNGQITVNNLVFGTYTSIETDPTPGFDLTNISCNDGQSTNPSSGNLGTRTVTFKLDPGETVKCIFTNTQRGSISGTKQEVNSDSSVVGTLSGWIITLFNGQTQVATASTDQSGNFSFSNLVAGVYTLAEQLQNGWTQRFTPPPITLGPGQDSTGNNFGNFQNGSIVGVKFNDLNGNGRQNPGEPNLSGWTIFIDANQNGQQDQGEISVVTDGSGYSFTNLPPGSYQICEVNQAGWVATTASCQIVDMNKSNQTSTVDFGNQGRATITVNKDVDTNGDGNVDIVGDTSWVWDIDGSGNFQTGSTQGVAAGTYSISEDQKANYHIVNLTCGQTDYGAVEGGDVTVGPGESIVCTFTNARDTGTITIIKNVDNNGDGDLTDEGDVQGATDWTWDIADGEQNIATGQSRTLPTGSYTISEDQKDGYNLVGWSCSNEQEGEVNSTTINLTKGSQVTCTFVNSFIPPVLTISKTNSGDQSPGGQVLYTITITNANGIVNSVSVIDLLPDGFTYRHGSWTANSSLRGDLKADGITTEPTYASPGTWQLGTMIAGEAVTLTYIADVSGGQAPGLYKDLAWAKGQDLAVNTVLALALDPGKVNDNFVSSGVNVVKEQQPATSVNIEGQVLGAATSLPATGEKTLWVILATILLATGAIALGGGLFLRRRYAKHV